MHADKAIQYLNRMMAHCRFTDNYGEPVNMDDYFLAVDTAIDALEKETPKACVLSSNTVICPSCDSCIGERHVFSVKRPDYCSDCGQALDWTAWERCGQE